MKDIKITGVVVLYNPDKEVIENINSYRQQFAKLYIVDNSTEDNTAYLKSIILNNVEYIPLKFNYGIAYALNLACKRAIEDGYQYIITLDQDSSFETNIVAVYQNYMENNDITDIAALSPQYRTDRTTIKDTQSEKEVFLTMQSGTLFMLQKYSLIGDFNENLFLDVVDWEYFYRIRKHNLKIVRCNKAILNHQPAITKKVSIGRFTLKYGIASPVRYYYQVRNLYWMVRHYKSVYMLWVMLIKFLKVILLFDHKKKYLEFCFRGIRDAKNERLGAFMECDNN
ncbi:MAG: glycosyltransferase [Lachnospiraceae bacterium]|nr:glycosyltransferase [Lachnospiraceae bacterium]